MFSLLLKEINSFLNSIIGYVAMLVFLLTIGLFMWVFPDTEFNVTEAGYAHLDTLFILAPWVFMFLIPAITMRSFAEEKKTGTIELLLTRPLSDFQILFTKYFAGLLIVVLSLLPTLVYAFSIYSLAVPKGNIDTGGIAGSYIGLLFIGSAFVSIGIFSSSISDNQIVAFIIAMFLCFFIHIGFESVSSFEWLGSADRVIGMLGSNAHYNSLSRGVIDTRDLVYFISLTLFFLLLTRFVMEKRKW
jgi:ABC-2 type transport system permease protein